MGFKRYLLRKIPRSLKNILKDSKLNYSRLYLIELNKKFFAPKYFGQTAEDAILRIYLPEKKGFYLDIGAGRPITGSNTYAMYLRGWSGLCVEPITVNARLLRALRRRDKVLNILVGRHETAIDFWEFEPYEYSTADESVAKKVLGYEGIRLLGFSKKIVRPLSDIAPVSSPMEASLLSVDVEGFDLEVLKSNNWESFYPRVICVEEWESTLDGELKSEIESFLISLDYRRKAWTGLSSVFVANSYLDSMPKL
jgi:FkbM family methyltransferase